MTNKEKIKIHVAQIENLEVQDEIQEGIEKFERLYRLKETDPRDSEVLFYKLSEIQSKVNEYKDMLNKAKSAYKELSNIINA